MWTMINLKMTFNGMMDWDLGANTIQGTNMITSIKYCNFLPKKFISYKELLNEFLCNLLLNMLIIG
jgi:hypothetical protein